ncbi:hypothetical protein MHU86_2599 [Fragilaria crotonensis]|nr:hypothetical protein MHU86_2599 [Fragilaria crotonensis]
MLRWVKRLTPGQKQAWLIGGSVVVVGAIVKQYYFDFARGLMMDGIKKNHLSATKKLEESREFARWAEQDRQKRVPPLTDEQRRQLQEYLDLLGEKHFGEEPRSR